MIVDEILIVDNFQESSTNSSENASGVKAHHGMFWKWLVAALVVLIVGVLVGYGWAGTGQKMSGFMVEPSADKWQAVFLTNGQVYFGHMSALNPEYFNLNNIYYLQVQQVVQPQPEDQTPQPNISLVKLGGELHGPEDTMFIPRDRILFWEDMKADSRVVQAIEQSLQ